MSENLETLSFEDAFEKLEAAVQRLEEGDLKLEEALALYEQGMNLARRCSQALDAAELRVQTLSPAEEQTQMGMAFTDLAD
jgi:exodeoxyribonuclease VII small subunit